MIPFGFHPTPDQAGQPGEACLTYGVYEPDTERKEFVTATCAEVWDRDAVLSRKGRTSRWNRTRSSS